MATIMKTYLHFTGGDNLLFQSWHPSSSGALAGACIGLALVALVERWLFATRAGLESYWRHKTLASEEKYCDNETARASSRPRKGRTAPPFTATHDILRGVVHAVQALLGYILMLAVM
ncbi:hypothetical protein D9757_006316 [Collybiopsis confluens]|uniref:Copper transport protein n=1 Tax=Collybiopsis confluens TaxID=2823264 RepID=A0A8H5HG88_9AGAR|nr:hypothetical protein D9757_006316 [Collybiopsis confluens]